MLEWQIKNANLTTVSNIYTCLLRYDVRKCFTFMAFHFHTQAFVIPYLHNKESHNMIFFILQFLSVVTISI
jgi:hypothetical protein